MGKATGGTLFILKYIIYTYDLSKYTEVRYCYINLLHLCRYGAVILTSHC